MADDADSISASSSSLPATLGGMFALVVWSSSVAVIRSLSESLGKMTGATLAAGIGGAAALAWAWSRGQSPRDMLRLPPRYLLVCGGLFAACVITLYAAIGWAANRPATLVVGLINYLWPALTVALSVPILKRKARWWLLPGCLVAVAGSVLAVLGGGEYCFPGLGPILLAAAAALSWALYSNLAKLWGDPKGGAVPLFVLASAVGLVVVRLYLPDDHPPVWSVRAAVELAILSLASQAAAYALWDLGMRRGNHVLLSLASYFVPVASVVIASAYLGVVPGANVVLGFCLVVAGALVCRFSLKDG